MVGNVGNYYDVLTYQSSDQLAVGTIVSVPVGKKTSLGVITKQVKQPNFVCKDIAKVVIDTPLPQTLLQLHSWLCDYYATKPGIAWQTILPARIASKPRFKDPGQPGAHTKNRTHILLNKQQRSAVAAIRATNSGTILLHGVTGSGKTEIYKTITQDVIDSGKSAIILVPEIALTAQLVGEFRNRFANVIVTHSAMTASERNAAWRQILFSQEPLVVIGPRSALFMPVHHLRQVVINECHEPSYK